MSRVYIFPTLERDLPGDRVGEHRPTVSDAMEEGDLLVRREGPDVQVWRYDGTEAEWIAEVPVDSLPDEAVIDLDPDEAEEPDDASGLPQALRGIVTAVRNRGA